MQGEQSDAEVIAAALADDGDFGDVWSRHFDAIFRYMASRAGREPARDLAADVFVVAVRRLHTYQRQKSESDSALPWLYGISQNVLRDHQKKQRRRERAYIRNDYQQAAAELQNTPEEEFAESALLPLVGPALTRLRQEERDVLLLKAVEELSEQDIADTLGIKLGTVKSRYARAKKKMQELLPPMRPNNGWGMNRGDEETVN